VATLSKVSPTHEEFPLQDPEPITIDAAPSDSETIWQEAEPAFQKDEQVEYWSRRTKTWVSARVRGVHFNGVVKLSVGKGDSEALVSVNPTDGYVRKIHLEQDATA
jgi:hypothetical protein